MSILGQSCLYPLLKLDFRYVIDNHTIRRITTLIKRHRLFYIISLIGLI